MRALTQVSSGSRPKDNAQEHRGSHTPRMNLEQPAETRPLKVADRCQQLWLKFSKTADRLTTVRLATSACQP
jgi:hypothetical protein